MCWCRLSQEWPVFTVLSQIPPFGPRSETRCEKGQALWAAREAQHMMLMFPCVPAHGRDAQLCEPLPYPRGRWGHACQTLENKQLSGSGEVYLPCASLNLWNPWIAEISEAVFALLAWWVDSLRSAGCCKWLRSSLSSFTLAMQRAKPQSLKSYVYLCHRLLCKSVLTKQPPLLAFAARRVSPNLKTWVDVEATSWQWGWPWQTQWSNLCPGGTCLLSGRKPCRGPRGSQYVTVSRAP